MEDVYIRNENSRQEASNANQVSEMHLQVSADKHLTFILEVYASCKVELVIDLVKDPIGVSNGSCSKK